MKGIVFTEFLEFVEQTFSLEIVDKIITQANLKSKGIYTAIGTYDHHEIMNMVTILSSETKVPVSELVKSFGTHLFFQLQKKYPIFFKFSKTTFQFLESVENHIHVEVKKLYKDTELPHFACSYLWANKFVMDYSSARPLGDLAEGMIKGCINYFKETILFERFDDKDNFLKKVRFILTKQST